MSTSIKGLDPIQYPGKKKVVSTYKLGINIVPGALIGYETWLPAGTDELHNMPFGDLTISVLYDDIVLFEPQSVTDEITLETQLDDDHVNTDHLLRIVLSGKSEKHTFRFNGTDKDAVATVKISLSIEDLPIKYCLEGKPIYFVNEDTNGQNWAEYMAQNGEQRVPINTPIYPWLISQHQDIITDIRQSICPAKLD